MDHVNLCATCNIVSRAAAVTVSSACERVRSSNSSRLWPGWLKVRKQPYLIEKRLAVLKQPAVQFPLIKSLKRLRHGAQDSAYRLEDASPAHRLLVVQEKGTVVLASRDISVGEVVALYAGELCTLQEVLGRDSQDHQWYQAELALPTGDRLVVDGTYHRSEVAEVCDVRVLELVAPALHRASGQHMDRNHVQHAGSTADLSCVQPCFASTVACNKLDTPSGSDTTPYVHQVVSGRYTTDSADAVEIHAPAVGTCKAGRVASDCCTSSDGEGSELSLSVLLSTIANQKPLHSSPSAGGVAGFASGAGCCSDKTPVGKVPTEQSNPVGKVPTGQSNPVGKVPTGQLNPVGKVPTGSLNPAGKVPVGSRNPVGKVPAGSWNPVGKVPAGSWNPVGKVPAGSWNPVGKVPAGSVGKVQAGSWNPVGTALIGQSEPGRMVMARSQVACKASYLNGTAKPQQHAVAAAGVEAWQELDSDCLVDTVNCQVDVIETGDDNKFRVAEKGETVCDMTAGADLIPAHITDAYPVPNGDSLNNSIATPTDSCNVSPRKVATGRISAATAVQDHHRERQTYFVKHKLEANVALVGLLDLDREELLMLVVAIKDIQAGEELMMDYGEDYWQQRLVQLNGQSMSEQEKARMAEELDVVKRELAALKASIRPLAEENCRLRQLVKQQKCSQVVLSKEAAAQQMQMHQLLAQGPPQQQQQQQSLLVCGNELGTSGMSNVEAKLVDCKVLPAVRGDDHDGNGQVCAATESGAPSAPCAATAAQLAGPAGLVHGQMQPHSSDNPGGGQHASTTPPVAGTLISTKEPGEPDNAGEPEQQQQRRGKQQGQQQAQKDFGSKHKVAAERLLHASQHLLQQPQSRRQQQVEVLQSPKKPKIQRASAAAGHKVQLLDTVIKLPIAPDFKRHSNRPATCSASAAGGGGHTSTTRALKQGLIKTAARVREQNTHQGTVAAAAGSIGTPAIAGVTPATKRAALPAKRAAQVELTVDTCKRKISRVHKQQQQQAVIDLTRESPRVNTDDSLKLTPASLAKVPQCSSTAAAATVAVAAEKTPCCSPPVAQHQQARDGKDRPAQQKKKQTPLLLDPRLQGQEEWQALRQRRLQWAAAQQQAKPQQATLATRTFQPKGSGQNATVGSAVVAVGNDVQQHLHKRYGSQNKRLPLADADMCEDLEARSKRQAIGNAMHKHPSTDSKLDRQQQGKPKQQQQQGDKGAVARQPALAPRSEQLHSQPLDEQQKEQLVHLAADVGVLATVLEQPAWEDILNSYQVHQTQRKVTKFTTKLFGQQRPRVCCFGCCSLND